MEFLGWASAGLLLVASLVLALRQRSLVQRVAQREARIREQEDRLLTDLEALRERGDELDAERVGVDERVDEARAELERVAGLTAAEAREEILVEAKRDARLRALHAARDVERRTRAEADREARNIIVGAIQRLAAEQTSESVVTVISLPSDEMKGRIIGREGRNIRAFEQVSGANVLIDDTPETVLISCFDPVRRETARIALDELVKDGRIHPQRIEETYERAERTMDERIVQAAQHALTEVGIVDLHPELVPVLGSLAFRTSYGQNVLDHLVESAHIAGMMAAELGLDVARCKRAAFLHDIGKALTHEKEGPHAIIGADLLRRHGEDEDIVHAVEAHHNEVEPHTVEAVLTQAADAISGARPGARRESLEAYVERMQSLEKIATSHRGVVAAYAMQSGHEVRVMVAPETIDDEQSAILADDIAKEIEAKLTFPGQIRITVVRESRAMATAH